MDVKRAFFSFLVAAIVPSVISLFIMRGESFDIFAAAGLLMIFYSICLFLVLPIGFISLFIALRIKGGPIILPPLVGAVVGFFFMQVTYTSGTEFRDKYHLLIYGVSTAITAALIYFQPWRKKSCERERQERPPSGTTGPRITRACWLCIALHH